MFANVNRMKLVLLGMVSALMLAGTAVAIAHEGEDHSASPYNEAMENYLAIQTALAGDSIKGIAGNAQEIIEATEALAADHKVAMNKEMAKLLPGITTAATAVTKAKDIKAARAAFGDLSAAMVSYRQLVGGEGPKVAYCPMADKSWLQNGKKITNPYFGLKMLHCGKFVGKK